MMTTYVRTPYIDADYYYDCYYYYCCAVVIEEEREEETVDAAEAGEDE